MKHLTILFFLGLHLALFANKTPSLPVNFVDNPSAATTPLDHWYQPSSTHPEADKSNLANAVPNTTTIELSVDKTTVYEGSAVVLKIKITATDANNMPLDTAPSDVKVIITTQGSSPGNNDFDYYGPDSKKLGGGFSIGAGQPISDPIEIEMKFKKDNLTEPDETFTVSLSSDTAGVMVVGGSKTITVKDNGKAIFGSLLDTSVNVVDESSSDITRVFGFQENEASNFWKTTEEIKIKMSDETFSAKLGADYRLFLTIGGGVEQEVTSFENCSICDITIKKGVTVGKSYISARIDIVDDTVYEGSGTDTIGFKFTSTTTTDLDLAGGGRYAVAKVTDNDQPPKVTATPNETTIKEDSGTVTYTVDMDHAAAFDINYEMTFDGSNSTATADDFEGIMTKALTIKAGNTTGKIEYTTTDDNLVEGDEMAHFTLKVKSPTTPSLVSGIKITKPTPITIDDNDVLKLGFVFRSSEKSQHEGDTSAPLKYQPILTVVNTSVILAADVTLSFAVNNIPSTSSFKVDKKRYTVGEIIDYGDIRGVIKIGNRIVGSDTTFTIQVTSSDEKVVRINSGASSTVDYTVKNDDYIKVSWVDFDAVKNVRLDEGGDAKALSIKIKGDFSPNATSTVPIILDLPRTVKITPSNLGFDIPDDGKVDMSVEFDLSAIDNTNLTGTQSVEVILKALGGGGPLLPFKIIEPDKNGMLQNVTVSKLTVDIIDNEAPQMTYGSFDREVTEGQSLTIKVDYTFSGSGSTISVPSSVGDWNAVGVYDNPEAPATDMIALPGDYTFLSTAIQKSDFTRSSSFIEAVSPKSFSVGTLTPIRDAIIEPDKVLYLRMAKTEFFNNERTPLKITIKDGDRLKLAFSSDTLDVVEGALDNTNPKLRVGDPNKSVELKEAYLVTVKFTTSNNSSVNAKSVLGGDDADIKFPGGTYNTTVVRIEKGSYDGTNIEIPMTVVDDNIYEGDESFKGTIVSVTTADANKADRMGTIDNSTLPIQSITVKDNETLSIRFDEASEAVTTKEDVGKTFVVVVLANKDDVEVKTDFEYNLKVDITGANFEDFEGGLSKGNFDAGTLPSTIKAGIYNKAGIKITLPIRVKKDNLAEIDETIKLSFPSSLASEFALGNPSEVTYTIENDDFLTIAWENTEIKSPEGTTTVVPRLIVSGAKIDASVVLVCAYDLGKDNTGVEEDDFSNKLSEIEISEAKDYFSDTFVSFPFSITKDAVLEYDETFTVSFEDTKLTDAQKTYVKLPAETLSYTILNDDNLTIKLSTAALSFDEDDPDKTYFGYTVSGAALTSDSPNIAFKVKITPQTAAFGSDYSITSTASLDDITKEATITIKLPKLDYNVSDNQSQKIVNFKVISDEYIEKDETVDFVLESVTDLPNFKIQPFSLGTTTSTYTIRNDDSITVGFETAEYASSENATGVDYNPPQLRVKGGSLEKGITIEVSFMVSGSGVADPILPGAVGSDIVLDGNTLVQSPLVMSIPKGDYTNEGDLVVVPVTYTHDNVLEEDEVFGMSLGKPSLGDVTVDENNKEATLKIKNDDFLTVGFSKKAYAANENDAVDTPALNITGAVVDRDLTVAVTVTPSTETGTVAPSGTRPDYSLGGKTSPLTITIKPKDYTKSDNQVLLLSDFTVVTDGYLESDETVRFDFGKKKSSEQIKFAGIIDAIYTIENDDVLTVGFTKETYASLENNPEDLPKLKVSGATLIENASILIMVDPNQETGTVPPGSDSDYNDYSLNGVEGAKMTFIIPEGNYVDNNAQILPVSNFRIEPDVLLETNETLSFKLSDSSGTVTFDEEGRTNFAILTIVNDDILTIKFDKNPDNPEEADQLYASKEGAAVSPIKFEVSGAQILDDYSVDWTVAAKANSGTVAFDPTKTEEAQAADRPDFLLFDVSGEQKTTPLNVSLRIQIPAGNYVDGQEIDVTRLFDVIDDKYLEETDVVDFSLSNVLKNGSEADTSVVLGKPTVYKIENDDFLTVSFTKLAYRSAEDADTIDVPTLYAQGAILTKDYTVQLKVSPKDGMVTFAETASGATRPTPALVQFDDNDYRIGQNPETFGFTIPEGDYQPKEVTDAETGDTSFEIEMVPIDLFKLVPDAFYEDDEVVDFELVDMGNDAGFILGEEKTDDAGVVTKGFGVKSTFTIVNDDFLSAEFVSHEAESLESASVTLPNIKLSGADMTRVPASQEISISVVVVKSPDDVDVSMVATVDEDFTLPKKLVIAKKDYNEAANQVMPMRTGFALIGDTNPEFNETIYLTLGDASLVRLEEDSNLILYKHLIRDDDPSALTTSISATPDELFSDGIAETTVTVVPKNASGEDLNLDDFLASGGVRDEAIKLTFVGVQTAVKAFGYDPVSQSLLGIYRASIPQNLVVSGIINDVKMDNKVTVRFVRPGIGIFEAMSTADSSPRILGKAPKGNRVSAITYGNRVEVIIDGETYKSTIENDPEDPDSEMGEWIIPNNTIPELFNGYYDVTITVFDYANNASEKKVYENALQIDLTDPNFFEVDVVVTSEVSPGLSGRANALTTVTLTINGVVYEVFADNRGAWSLEKGKMEPLEKGKEYTVTGFVTTAGGREGTPRDFVDVIVVTKDVVTRNEGFSPDGDGVNDNWNIIDIEKYPKNSVVIYNRWGNIVWEAKGYDNGDVSWDGAANTGLLSAGAQLPLGIYFYQLILGDGSKPISGNVTIIK